MNHSTRKATRNISALSAGSSVFGCFDEKLRLDVLLFGDAPGNGMAHQTRRRSWQRFRPRYPLRSPLRPLSKKWNMLWTFAFLNSVAVA